MTTYHLKGLLQHTGWMENAQVTVNDKGNITAISEFDPKDNPLGTRNGIAVPGFQNAHSHAFQYAMAGLIKMTFGDGGKPCTDWP